MLSSLRSFIENEKPYCYYFVSFPYYHSSFFTVFSKTLQSILLNFQIFHNTTFLWNSSIFVFFIVTFGLQIPKIFFVFGFSIYFSKRFKFSVLTRDALCLSKRPSSLPVVTGWLKNPNFINFLNFRHSSNFFKLIETLL